MAQGRDPVPVFERVRIGLESEIQEIIDKSAVRPWDSGIPIPVRIGSRHGEVRNYGEMLDWIKVSPLDGRELTGKERTTESANTEVAIENTVFNLWHNYGFDLFGEEFRLMENYSLLYEEENEAIDAYRRELLNINDEKRPNREKQQEEEGALEKLNEAERERLIAMRTLFSALGVVNSEGKVDPSIGGKSPAMTYFKWMGLLYRRALNGSEKSPVKRLMDSEPMVEEELKKRDPSFSSEGLKNALPELLRAFEESLSMKYQEERNLEWELEVVVHDLLESGSEFNLTGVSGELLSGYLYETEFKGGRLPKALEILGRRWPEQMQALDVNGYAMFMPPELDGRVRIIVQNEGVKFQLDGQFFGFLSHSEGLQKSLPQLRPLAL